MAVEPDLPQWEEPTSLNATTTLMGTDATTESARAAVDEYFTPDITLPEKREEPPLPSDLEVKPPAVPIESVYIDGAGLPSQEDLGYIVGSTGDVEEEKWRTANMRFMEEVIGKDPDDVTIAYDSYHKPTIARELGLKEDASNKAIAEKIKEGFLVKQKADNFYQELSQTAVADAVKLSDKPWHVAFGSHLPSAEDRRKMTFVGREVFSSSKAMNDYGRIYQKARSFAKAHPDIANWDGNMDDLPDLAREISSMDKNDRRYAVMMMQTMNEREGKALPIVSDIMNAFKEASGEMVDARNLMYSRARLNLIAKSEEPVYQDKNGKMEIESVLRPKFGGEIPEGWTKMEKGEAQAKAQELLNYTQLMTELEVYYGQGREQGGFIREGVIGAAQSLPEMGRAIALSPFGFGAFSMIEGMTSQKYKEVIATYPDIPEHQAQAIASLSGTVQGVLEHWQLKNILGSNTVVGKAIGEFTNIGSPLWKRLLTKFGATWAEQTAEEVSQNIADVLIDELAQAAGAEISPSAKARFNEMFKQSPALLVTTALFGGLGTLTSLALDSPRAQDIVKYGTASQLRALGFSPEQATEIIDSDDRLRTAKGLSYEGMVSTRATPNSPSPEDINRTVGPKINPNPDGTYTVTEADGSESVVDSYSDAEQIMRTSIEMIPQESVDDIGDYAVGDVEKFVPSSDIRMANRVAASSIDLETGETTPIYGSPATIKNDVETYAGRIASGEDIAKVTRAIFASSIDEAVEAGVVTMEALEELAISQGYDVRGEPNVEIRNDMIMEALSEVGQTYALSFSAQASPMVQLNTYEAGAIATKSVRATKKLQNDMVKIQRELEKLTACVSA